MTEYAPSVTPRSPWDVMAWARATRTGSPGRKATLMALAEHAGIDDEGAASCWPSQATLAAATEQSVRTVRDQLRELEAAGFIRREGRIVPGRGRSSPKIFLLCRAADIAARQDPPTGPPASTDGSPDVDPIGPGTSPADAGGPTNASERQGERQSNTNGRESLELKLDEAPPPPSVTFEEWYAAYPRKKQPLDARKAWLQALRTCPRSRDPREVAEMILAHTTGPWRAEIGKRPIDKVPYPATYLRSGEWLSETDEDLVAASRRQRALKLAGVTS